MARPRTNTTGFEDHFADACSHIVSGTISVFLLILVTVFPLILHDSYVDVLQTKYQCYYVTIIGMLAVLSALALVMLILDHGRYRGEHTARLFAKLRPKHWKATFCAADFAVIAFWLILLISTLQSEYLYESFWGNEGRYSGFFLMTLYVISYFVISRFWKAHRWVLDAF